MNIINTKPLPDIMTPEKLLSFNGDFITIQACVYKIRRASGIVFVSLSHDRYIYQGVYMPEICENSLNEICEGAYIELTATVKEEKRADYGVELTMKSFKVLSMPVTEFPICITQPTLTCNLTENLNNRTVALRHPKEKAVMNIVSNIKFALAESLKQMGFNDISTPKITTVSDKTTDYIKVRYFGNDCNLALSPHYYKQMALCTFSRVYEIATHFSDVNRNSTRHLNEYTCLDFEMAYNSKVTDIMQLVTLLLNNTIDYLNKNCSSDLTTLGIALSPITSIPAISFSEAMEILGKTGNDIDPTDEAKLSVYAKEQFDCEFLFVTGLPALNLPFYTRNGENFILICNGITIAHGSENINDYNELIKEITDRGLDAEDYTVFTDTFQYGMPPHGGASIGLERLVMKLFRLENIREATLFPRDLHHITP